MLDFSVNQSTQQQANLWINSIDRGLSTKQIVELKQWVNKSSNHKDVLFHSASLWDDISILDKLTLLFPESESNKSKKYVTNLAVVSAIFLIISTSFFHLFSDKYFQWQAPTNSIQSPQLYSTAIGERAQFSLPDGSSIELNTNTRLRVNFSPKQRLITLISGEAIFDVAKDKDRPFTVMSGNESFTALGTRFNVQKNSSRNNELIVTEGKVLITPSDHSLKKIPRYFTSLDENQLPGTLVKAGEKANLSAKIEYPVVSAITKQDIASELAWQDGVLIFTGQTLDKAMQEVTRYTGTSFEIANQSLNSLEIAGYFKANDLNGLLQSLQSNFAIHAEKLPNNKVILSSTKAKDINPL